MVKLEIVCPESSIDKIVSIIRQEAHTGRPGDGIIYVSSVDMAVKVRTGERDRDALVWYIDHTTRDCSYSTGAHRRIERPCLGEIPLDFVADIRYYDMTGVCGFSKPVRADEAPNEHHTWSLINGVEETSIRTLFEDTVKMLETEERRIEIEQIVEPDIPTVQNAIERGVIIARGEFLTPSQDLTSLTERLVLA